MGGDTEACLYRTVDTPVPNTHQTCHPSDQLISFEHKVHHIDDHGSVCVKRDSGTHHAVHESSLEASP